MNSARRPSHPRPQVRNQAVDPEEGMDSAEEVEVDPPGLVPLGS